MAHKLLVAQRKLYSSNLEIQQGKEGGGWAFLVVSANAYNIKGGKVNFKILQKKQ